LLNKFIPPVSMYYDIEVAISQIFRKNWNTKKRDLRKTRIKMY